MHLVDVQQHRNRKPISHRETLRSQISTVTRGWHEGNHVVCTWSCRINATFSNETTVETTVKMRIEELILEGFKSYPVRTQITGWDPSFNAITGLNGSGKSNILDAICFVLGLTNMSSVRVPHHLCITPLLIMSSYFRCVPRINRISYINVDKLASPRHLSPSSLTTRTGKTALQEWRAALR